jgi:hypothetical protein
MLNSSAVIGAGGWGITLAKLLADKGKEVALWCRGAETFRDLLTEKESRVYLPGIKLPASVQVTQSLQEAVANKRLIISAVPSHAVREVITAASFHVSADAIVVCGTKGLEEGSLKTMGEVLGDIFGQGHKKRLAFLSGPTFAVEVARGLPAAVTVAACDGDLRALLSLRGRQGPLRLCVGGGAGGRAARPPAGPCGAPPPPPPRGPGYVHRGQFGPRRYPPIPKRGQVGDAVPRIEQGTDLAVQNPCVLRVMDHCRHKYVHGRHLPPWL